MQVKVFWYFGANNDLTIANFDKERNCFSLSGDTIFSISGVDKFMLIRIFSWYSAVNFDNAFNLYS